MPAVSAAPRCAASTPLKNRSPELLSHLALQLRNPPLRPTHFPPSRETRCPDLQLLSSPTMQGIGVDLNGARQVGNRNSHLQAPNRAQLEFPCKRPSRQAHDSKPPFAVLCVLTGCLKNGTSPVSQRRCT